MTGTKHRSQYRKKRKGNAFAGVQKHAEKVRKTSLKESEITQSTPSSACDQPSSSSKCDEPISASRLKMRPQNSSDCPSNSLDDGETVQSEGYRLVDLKKLSSTLSEAHVCDEGKNSEKQNTVCSVQMMLYGKMCVVVEFGLLFESKFSRFVNILIASV